MVFRKYDQGHTVRPDKLGQHNGRFEGSALRVPRQQQDLHVYGLAVFCVHGLNPETEPGIYFLQKKRVFPADEQELIRQRMDYSSVKLAESQFRQMGFLFGLT